MKSQDCTAAVRNIIEMSHQSGHTISENAAQDLLKQVNEHLILIDEDLAELAAIIEDIK